MLNCCTGGAREPELMQHAFSCISSICKHLQRPLAADIPTVQLLHDLAVVMHLGCSGFLFGSRSRLLTPVPGMLFTPCLMSRGA